MATVEPVVRRATADDAQLIADLTRAAWAGKVVAESSGHRESADRVRADLAAGGGFVMTAADVPAGSIRWAPVGPVWEIMRVGILPPYRGRGWMTLLLNAVYAAALDAQVADVRVGIRRDQPRLLEVYAAQGFDLAADLRYTHANPDQPPPYVMRRWLTPPSALFSPV
jgi:GNAT superfamily N-acetyltransferase